jgi:hypothetical protein
MNVRVPLNAGNFLSGCTIGSFSRKAQLHEWVSIINHDAIWRRGVSLVFRLLWVRDKARWYPFGWGLVGNIAGLGAVVAERRIPILGIELWRLIVKVLCSIILCWSVSAQYKLYFFHRAEAECYQIYENYFILQEVDARHATWISLGSTIRVDNR